MKPLLRSLENLVVSWVAQRCPKDDENYHIYVAAAGPIVVGDLIKKAIASENARIVKPILIRYADTISDRIPVMFRVRGHHKTRLRHNQAYDHHGLHRHWIEVTAVYSGWYTLSDEGMVRLYEKLLEGGYFEPPLQVSHSPFNKERSLCRG